jgi:zinc protease
MLFKGTERRAVGEIAQEVEEAGGDINAFTSNDQTVYHLVIASRYFDTGLDILADAIEHSSFDPTELSKEEEVVMEELRRSEDDPNEKIYRYLFETAYQVHTYRRPIIGYKETLLHFTRDQIVNFYHHWYVADNLIVVIVGDVKAETAAAKVQELFGAMPKEPNPRSGGSARDTKEPPQTGLRIAIHPAKIAESYLSLGFHTPAFASEDMAALDALSVIAGMGESSRLVQRVRSEKQLVNKILCYDYTPLDPGLFLVGAELMTVKAPEALSEILRQIYLFKHQPVEPWELDKAKLQIESDADYSRETVQGQARKLGYFAVLTGDPNYEDQYLKQVQAVTAEDLMRVANKYLLSTNLTLAALAPDKDAKDFNSAKAEAAVHRVDEEETGGQSASWAGKETTAAPQVPAAAAGVEAKELGVKEPVRFTLKNGIRLIVKERHDVPLVSVRAVFRGGVLDETKEDNGINNFIAQAITEGTETRTAKQIHSQIEAMAASLDGFSGRNSLGVTLESLSKFFDPALELAADLIRHPSFPPEEMDKARLIILSNIRTQKDLPQRVAMNNFRAALYPDHPYGMNILGTEEVVQKLSPRQLKDYYFNLARPGNLVIAVVGDVEAKAVKKRIEALFGDWGGEAGKPPEIPREAPPTEIRKVTACMDRNQSNLVLGFQGATLDSPDRYRLLALNGILSSMGGRLFLILRDQQSLAYSVYAANEDGLDPGFIWVYIGTAPEKEETALGGIIAQLERIRTEPVTAEELERAKKSLIGGFEIDLQRNSNQASHLAFDELYGLGYRDSELFAERIQGVTAEQVLKAAQTYFKLDAYVLSVVKPCPSPP